jgi:hypothetical protein
MCARAAALQYGIYRSAELPEKEEEGIAVMFVDVGYADTTASVVRVRCACARVVCLRW